MKWITREKVKVDRVACPWLIKKFIDPEAESLYRSAEKLMGFGAKSVKLIARFFSRRKRAMKWITREKIKVDRVACPWLIKKFIDPEAQFLFVPAERVLEVAKREGAIPFDAPGVELGHHEGKCSFETIVARYRIEEPAIHLLAEIVHGADCAKDLYGRPEAAGLKAIAEGFRYLGLKDDHEILEKEFIVYDALYAYCQQKAAKGQNRG